MAERGTERRAAPPLAAGARQRGRGGPGGGRQGGPKADGALSDRDAAIDRALAAVYDSRPEPGKRSAGLGGSAPSVHRWLGDIRTYFPTPVVQVLQHDAMDRLGLRQMLLEPELLAAVQPDVHLVGTLLSLQVALPEQTRQTARIVVAKVVEEIERRLRPSCTGPCWARSTGPRATAGPGWPTSTGPPRSGPTCKHYQPDLRTIIAEQLIGHSRRRRIAALQDVDPAGRPERLDGLVGRLRRA